jgi:hypothetical protein
LCGGVNNTLRNLDKIELSGGLEPFPGYSESYLPGGFAQEENTSNNIFADENGEISSLNQQESMRYALAAFKKPNYFYMLHCCGSLLYMHVALTTEMKTLDVWSFGNMEISLIL